MPESVLCKLYNLEQAVYFNRVRAILPVKQRRGEPLYIPWGRRQNELGALPLGGWAHISSINEGHWDKYFPKPVKIMASKFMERDHEGAECWYIVTGGQYIQGALCRDGDEFRVYIVTLTPTRPDATHTRWPKIIFCG